MQSSLEKLDAIISAMAAENSNLVKAANRLESVDIRKYESTEADVSVSSAQAPKVPPIAAALGSLQRSSSARQQLRPPLDIRGAGAGQKQPERGQALPPSAADADTTLAKGRRNDTSPLRFGRRPIQTAQADQPSISKAAWERVAGVSASTAPAQTVARLPHTGPMPTPPVAGAVSSSTPWQRRPPSPQRPSPARPRVGLKTPTPTPQQRHAMTRRGKESPSPQPRSRPVEDSQPLAEQEASPDLHALADGPPPGQQSQLNAGGSSLRISEETLREIAEIVSKAAASAAAATAKAQSPSRRSGSPQRPAASEGSRATTAPSASAELAQKLRQNANRSVTGVREPAVHERMSKLRLPTQTAVPPRVASRQNQAVASRQGRTSPMQKRPEEASASRPQQPRQALQAGPQRVQSEKQLGQRRTPSPQRMRGQRQPARTSARPGLSPGTTRPRDAELPTGEAKGVSAPARTPPTMPNSEESADVLRLAEALRKQAAELAEKIAVQGGSEADSFDSFSAALHLLSAETKRLESRLSVSGPGSVVSESAASLLPSDEHAPDNKQSVGLSTLNGIPALGPLVERSVEQPAPAASLEERPMDGTLQKPAPVMLEVPTSGQGASTDSNASPNIISPTVPGSNGLSATSLAWPQQGAATLAWPQQGMEPSRATDGPEDGPRACPAALPVRRDVAENQDPVPLVPLADSTPKSVDISWLQPLYAPAVAPGGMGVLDVSAERNPGLERRREDTSTQSAPGSGYASAMDGTRSWRQLVQEMKDTSTQQGNVDYRSWDQIVGDVLVSRSATPLRGGEAGEAEARSRGRSSGSMSPQQQIFRMPNIYAAGPGGVLPHRAGDVGQAAVIGAANRCISRSVSPSVRHVVATTLPGQALAAPVGVPPPRVAGASQSLAGSRSNSPLSRRRPDGQVLHSPLLVARPAGRPLVQSVAAPPAAPPPSVAPAVALCAEPVVVPSRQPAFTFGNMRPD
eukprot:TRINITY_DN2496_c0_g1_i2.p1 TRINITY_DN2496_c0_g1~~TRINITY_DN2496_c0_g1_i2.p1  ORF type:complete len:975 (-),score=159.19 TRINITY_DN2496_c0_g1_i2:364-3288(-)